MLNFVRYYNTSFVLVQITYILYATVFDKIIMRKNTMINKKFYNST